MVFKASTRLCQCRTTTMENAWFTGFPLRQKRENEQKQSGGGWKIKAPNAKICTNKWNFPAAGNRNQEHEMQIELILSFRSPIAGSISRWKCDKNREHNSHLIWRIYQKVIPFKKSYLRHSPARNLNGNYTNDCFNSPLLRLMLSVFNEHQNSQ